MKKLVILCLVALMVPAVFGELVLNSDFSAGDASWGSMSAWGSYFYNDGSDDIWSGGGWGNNDSWSNTSIWQETSSTFLADTVYTMTVDWRDPDGVIDVDSIQLSIQETAGWTDVAVALDGPLATPDTWSTATLTFDTATNPSVVGSGIGVGVRLTSGTGTWVHVNSVSLVPEPATLCLLGLGGLLLRKRR